MFVMFGLEPLPTLARHTGDVVGLIIIKLKAQPRWQAKRLELASLIARQTPSSPERAGDGADEPLLVEREAHRTAIRIIDEYVIAGFVAARLLRPISERPDQRGGPQGPS